VIVKINETCIEQNKLSILIIDILVTHTAHSFIAEASQTHRLRIVNNKEIKDENRTNHYRLWFLFV